jgi:hypothetical protein
MLLEVPVEVRLELGPVVRLDDKHLKGESTNNLIDEAYSGRLVAGIVDL